MTDQIASITPVATDLNTPCSPTWCPGCGNFAILSAFKKAATQEGWNNTNTSMVAGIGCHGHIVNYVKLTSVEGLHGRAIPVGTGIKMANHELNVFVFTGDGDCMGEGGNHFIHACRRNHDITIVLHNNNIYGLTTGQTSPTSPHNFKTKSTPDGNPDYPLLPVPLAIASGATFVAREYAGNVKELTELLIRANSHKGISILEVVLPCVSFNKEFGAEFFKENTYRLPEDYDVTDKVAAFAKALEWGSHQVPLGVFYEEAKPSYESEIPQLQHNILLENTYMDRDVTGLLRKQG